MKIIVCGAGQVGTGIARQLAEEGNDVTIIDPSPELIQKIGDSLDVKAFVGFPSHPPVLEEAGAIDADMVIAVTVSDEINMVICQVMHSLFGVPTKIARIRHPNYLYPIWKDLYRREHLPIDYIISPEKEVANAIMNRMHVPGAMDMIPFFDGKLKIIEVRCPVQCPLMGMPMDKVKDKLREIDVSLMALLRDEKLIIPNSKNTSLEPEDAVFFATGDANLKEAMKMFGHEEKEARRVLIIGGGNIGLYVSHYLESDQHEINAKLIELDKERAEYVASQLKKTIVINGDSLDHEIMMEANIEATETIISVTNDDEVNIFSSILAKRAGCQRSIALINKSGAYSNITSTLGLDVVVNPREITVSTILQHVRRGKVRAAYSICGGNAEIIETEAFVNSSIIGQTISALDLSENVLVAAIARGEKIIIPNSNEVIEENDNLLIISTTTELKKVDKIFSARQNYF